MTEPNIVAVIVLYKRMPEESEAFASLRSILCKRADLASAMCLLLYDNSPIAQEIPSMPTATRYISNIANEGIIPAYRTALQMAIDNGTEWLLLLDQDTVLTESYLVEMLSILPKTESSVVAVIPKLFQGGVISPHFMPRLTFKGVDATFIGTPEKEITAFNSAAALRVSALRAIGGFPALISPEFLDHTVFHLLKKSGGKIWVMGSTLLHDLSLVDADKNLPFEKYKNILYSERDFYMRRRNVSDRIWYRIRKFKEVVTHLLKFRKKQFVIWDIRAALGILGRQQ